MQNQTQNLNNMKHPQLNELIAIGRFFESKGWAAATSGNYSVRLDHQTIAITQSGKHKGELTSEDFVLVDYQGDSLDNRRPSAETLLHTSLYQQFGQVNCVLHTHSVNSVVASRIWERELPLQDYEMLKAFPGVHTHQSRVNLSIFDNSQNIKELAELISPNIHPQTPAYIIRNHGIYGWGSSPAEARRVIEAVEYMIECELRLKMYKV